MLTGSAHTRANLCCVPLSTLVYVCAEMFGVSLFRRISSRQLGRLLLQEHPTVDPRSVKPSRLVTLTKKIMQSRASSETPDYEKVLDAWKSEYNKQMHDSAYEEMADPGEQCDGELPSWTRDRLSVEKDKNFNVPSVSAHEAITRINQKKK